MALWLITRGEPVLFVLLSGLVFFSASDFTRSPLIFYKPMPRKTEGSGASLSGLASPRLAAPLTTAVPLRSVLQIMATIGVRGEGIHVWQHRA